VKKKYTLVMHFAIRASRDKRKQSEIQRIKLVCSPLLQGTNSKIYLFGSYATGSFSSLSDVDVLIVTDHEDAARSCAAQLPGDTVVTTPEALQQKREHSLFWKNVDQEKEVICEYSE
jgi:predicted nucleotidyltransferase